MDYKETIITFNKRANWAIALSCFFKGIMRALPIVFVGTLVLSGLDQWFEIPVYGRQIFWFVICGVSLFVFVQSYYPFEKFGLVEKSKNLSLNTPSVKLRKDELRLSIELTKEQKEVGISQDLKASYLEQMAQRLSHCSAYGCVAKWNWKNKFLVTFLILASCSSLWALFPTQFPLGSRALFPFGGSNLSDFIEVEPGDAEVQWGGSQEVKITLKIRSLDKPVLYVKTDKDWLAVDAQKEEQATQIYTFVNLVEPLFYRVKWKKDWGRKFKITPQKQIRVDQFKIKIRQPDYVGKQIVRQESPELTGLPGSLISFEAIATEPISQARVLFSDGSEEKVSQIAGNKLSGQFTLFKSGTYGFFLQTPDGRITENKNLYPIHVQEDNSPSVTLLSPESDLIVGDKEKLPLTFTASDDFGLKKVVLRWKKTSGQREKVIQTFQEPQESVLDTYEWDLDKESFKPGEVIEYQIQVFDGNSVTGPGVDTTEWRLIEIASFEKGHEALEKALEQWRDEVLDLLADVNTAKAKAEMENANLQEMTKEFNQTSFKSKQLEKALEKIVSLMEQDPLADYGVWLEHDAMSENFKALNNDAMRKAQAALQTQNKESAMNQMDRVSAELERMHALSEELSKNQRARDMLESGDNLSDVGEDLLDQLESAAQSGQKMDPEQMAQLNQLLNEAQKLLSDMARQMQKFPEELPEDFVNQEALKNLEMDKTQDILSQIQDALKKGDMQKAMELAKQFLNMAKKMREQLGEAHESYLQENSAEELSEQISEQQKKLDEITEKQRDILAQTQKLESKRLAEFLKQQEELLNKLLKRQEKVIAATTKLLEKTIKPVSAQGLVSAQLASMSFVAKEFKTKKLDKSVTLLANIIERLGNARDEIKKSTGSVSSMREIEKLQAEEQSILDELKKPLKSNNVFSESDKKTFSNLKEKQKSLSQKTKRLNQSLQRLSQKTANLGIPLTQSLSEAGNQMIEASEALNKIESKSAQKAEEGALQNLQKAQNSLQQAQEAMGDMAQQMGQGSGQGGGQPKALMRGQKPGQRGSQTGKVRLPTADEYKPPKEFREELLESLKEKFPDSYEDIIYKYFKRLSE